MKLDLKPLAGAVAMALSTGPTFATTQFLGDRITFSGFGTVGATRTDTDAGEFKRDDEKSGADRDIDANIDSNLGLQLTFKANDYVSATVQSLTMQRLDGNTRTQAEWAYVKLKPAEPVSILAGRIGLPMFLISDSRNVGYANIWLRPPNEVYGIALLHRLDGASASYNLPIKSGSLTVTAIGGKSKGAIFGGLLDVKHVRGLNVTWELDWLTLRAGQLEGIVVQADDRYVFSGIGATVDRANIVAQAEYVTRRSKRGFSSAVDADGWYTLAGYRINKFVPYASYASTKPKIGGTGHLTETQSTLAAGIRWDAFDWSAIKFQVERIDTHDTSGVSFSTPALAGGFGPATSTPITKPVTAVSLAMDVVF